MDKDAFNQYVENRYRDQMNYYDSKAGKNQKRYRQFQWILIVLSALTPVAAALDGKWFSLQILVIIISSVVAILTTGLKTFQYQEIWVTYRATYEQLKPEIYYYNFNVGPYSVAGVDKESLFVTRVEEILDKEHKGWPPAKKMREEQGTYEKEGRPSKGEELPFIEPPAKG